MAFSPEEFGLTPIHYACLNGNLKTVVTSIQRNAELLSDTTQEGATPIMLASLMGYYEIVHFLVVDMSADVNLVDKVERNAAVYAGENLFAHQARHEYVDTGLGQEHPFAARNRQDILGLLQSPTRRIISKTRHRQGGDSGFHEFRLAPIGSKIGVFGLVDTIDTKVPLPEIKTLGFIMTESDNLPIRSAFDFGRDSQDSTMQGPAFYASSGWKTSPDRHPQVVDSGLWGWVAHKLVAPIFGHVFTRGRDNGNLVPEPEHEGRVQACHVEVVLSTFYAFSLTEALVHRKPGQDEQDYIREQYKHLGEIRWMTLGARRNMVIHIDSWPCDSCKDYVAGIEWLTELRFRIKGGCSLGRSSTDARAKGARFAPAEELADVDDQLAEAEAALAGNPTLMEQFRYNSTRGGTATTPSVSAESIGETPFVLEGDDDADDDDDSSDSEIVFTPPPTTPVGNIQAFRQQIRTFQYVSTSVEPRHSKSQPQRARGPRYPQFVINNPLAHKPKHPTPVWDDPFENGASQSSAPTIIESMEMDEEPQAEEVLGSEAAPYLIEDDDEE